MRVLLDTHAFLWWLDGDRRLSLRARRVIGDGKNAVLEGDHRDPFDRMLIAQAQIEDLPLVTNETLFDDYGVTRLW